MDSIETAEFPEATMAGFLSKNYNDLPNHVNISFALL